MHDKRGLWRLLSCSLWRQKKWLWPIERNIPFGRGLRPLSWRSCCVYRQEDGVLYVSRTDNPKARGDKAGTQRTRGFSASFAPSAWETDGTIGVRGVGSFCCTLLLSFFSFHVSWVTCLSLNLSAGFCRGLAQSLRLCARGLETGFAYANGGSWRSWLPAEQGACCFLVSLAAALTGVVRGIKPRLGKLTPKIFQFCKESTRRAPQHSLSTYPAAWSNFPAQLKRGNEVGESRVEAVASTCCTYI